ncbi:DMT family transporter [Acinetobacter courvalinii]|uniref:DMT family transporter n=1 Tax=Acinetobacter courvalinii TaxID=280147 RepID=UPI0021CD7418|nr:DMT family transporter [Acinetobacter courvalinii]MCU4389363.1 DMT family transporter [Acinetobacter courvalinii]
MRHFAIALSSSTVYLKLICVALMWGGTFIAGRIVTAELSPTLSALLRFGFAAILLVLILLKSTGGFPHLSVQQHVYAILMGLTGVFAYNLFFFAALSRIEAGRTALFVSLSPILTILAMRIFFQERLGRINYLGVCLALMGTLIVVSRGEFFAAFAQSFGTGEMMMCGAVLSWVIYTICFKQTQIPALTMTTYSLLWGTGFLLLSAWPELRSSGLMDISWSSWLSILYLGAFGTVLAFIWYAEAIHSIGASRTIIFNNLVPVFAVLLAFLILNEPITWSMLVGGSLSFIGVILTNKQEK